jgi:hypothetical protein
MRISFGACHPQMLALWTVLAAARVRAQIARQALRVGRPHSCDLKVRQPVKQWSRMFVPTSLTSAPQIETLPIA